MCLLREMNDLDFFSIGFVEQRGTGRERKKKQNENVCLQQDNNLHPV